MRRPSLNPRSVFELPLHGFNYYAVLVFEIDSYFGGKIHQLGQNLDTESFYSY